MFGLTNQVSLQNDIPIITRNFYGLLWINLVAIFRSSSVICADVSFSSSKPYAYKGGTRVTQKQSANGLLQFCRKVVSFDKSNLEF